MDASGDNPGRGFVRVPAAGNAPRLAGGMWIIAAILRSIRSLNPYTCRWAESRECSIQGPSVVIGITCTPSSRS